jgi:hypothetical protein
LGIIHFILYSFHFILFWSIQVWRDFPFFMFSFVSTGRVAIFPPHVFSVENGRPCELVRGVHMSHVLGVAYSCWEFCWASKHNGSRWTEVGRNSIDKFPKHFACEKWLIVVGSFVGQTSPTEVPLLIFYYEIDIELRMRWRLWMFGYHTGFKILFSME